MREQYKDKPRTCQTCNEIIPFEKRINTFCSKSCAQTFTNRNRGEAHVEKLRETWRRKLGVNELGMKKCQTNRNLKLSKPKKQKTDKSRKHTKDEITEPKGPYTKIYRRTCRKTNLIFYSTSAGSLYHPAVYADRHHYKRCCAFTFSLMDYTTGLPKA